MVKEIKFLAVVPGHSAYTAYFYNKETKTVLPIEVPEKNLNLFMDNNNGTGYFDPRVEKAFAELLEVAKLKLVCISIHATPENCFYAFMHVRKCNEKFLIECDFCSAIGIALKAGIPIRTGEVLLEQRGIKVTKSLLERSLRMN